MATYSENSFNTKHYNDARPSYPNQFYDTLMQYHKSETGRALDIGCGSGFVAFQLKSYFNQVIGTDLSPGMIEQCKNDPRTKGNVNFYVAPAERAPDVIGADSLDMITGAECCHWVDHDRFFKESHRILKQGGTLAYWFYKDPIFVDFPEANDIYNDFCYENPLYMGPKWQQPGRNLLRTLLKEIQVRGDLFTDIVRVEYEPLRDQPSSLYISKTVTLKLFKDYITSWSAYHEWKKQHPEEKDVADQFIDKLKETFAWDDDFKFTITWATAYTFARKR